MNILILLFTILFFILAWRRLDWAAMFLIVFLPAYLIRFKIFGLPATILEVMIWIVFAVWVIKNFFQIKNNFLENFKKSGGKFKIRYPFDWEIIFLLIVSLLAVGVAGFNASAFGVWKAYFFEPVLLFIVALNVMKGEKGQEKILWSLAISALVVSALAIYQKITGQMIDNSLWAAADTRRVVSFFGYPNAVGLYLGPLVLAMMGWLFNTVKNFQFFSPRLIRLGRAIFNFQTIFNVKIFKPVFIGLTVILSVFPIYFAKSTGALLGVAVGLIVFGLLAGKKTRWATVAAALIMVAGLLSYQPARTAAIDTIFFKTLSGQIRLAGWSDAWKMLKDGRLITGAGLADYQAAVAPYHTEGIFIKDYSDPDAQRKLVFNEAYRTAHWQPLEIYLYPHNIILNFWSELGLAGLLLFIWIIGKYFWLGISHTVIAASEPQSRSVASAKTWIPGQARNDRKEYKFLTIGLIGAMIAIIIHGLVDAPYFKNDLAVMFWLLVAMMSLINLENNYGKNL